jgi:hypothetical protein
MRALLSVGSTKLLFPPNYDMTNLLQLMKDATAVEEVECAYRKTGHFKPVSEDICLSFVNDLAFEPYVPPAKTKTPRADVALLATDPPRSPVAATEEDL